MTGDSRFGFDGTEKFWTPNAEEAEEWSFLATEGGTLMSSFGIDDDYFTPDEATTSFVVVGHHDEVAVRGFAEQWTARHLEGADTRIDPRGLEHRWGRFEIHERDNAYSASWVFLDTAAGDPDGLAVTTARRFAPALSVGGGAA